MAAKPVKEEAKAARSQKEVDVEKQRKHEALKRAVDLIEKNFGTGSIQKLTSDGNRHIPSISTGTLALDLALGVGGVPKGRVVEIFGPESSGKTTLALTIVANAQKEGGVAAYIDAEHALDPQYMKKLGVKLDELLVSQPDTGEQALEICEQLVRSAAVDVVVIDSVAALVPRAEIEGEMGDSHVGLQARLMSQALRKLTSAIARSKTIVIFINQLREKIGVMYGSPETTPGGRALKFYASVRIDIRRIGMIKEGENVIGSQCKAKVVKNKVAPPFKQAEFEIMYDRGISWEGSLLDMGVLSGVVEKSGSWLGFAGNRLGQGRENARKFLLENPATSKEIHEKIMAKQDELLHSDVLKADMEGGEKAAAE
ncbi:MAG TPA: recombinase RecA [Planctomycetota bacterium]|nr:recombinase RecA [Planctomycetota bacterium]